MEKRPAEKLFLGEYNDPEEEEKERICSRTVKEIAALLV